MYMLNQFFRFFFPAKLPAEIIREYNIPEKIRFHFESAPNGWVIATSPDLPGFITQAKNKKALLSMLNDGVLTYFDVPKRVGDFVFNTLVV